MKRERETETHETGTETERSIHKERQTETERETDSQTGSGRDRHRGRQRQREAETDRQTDRHTERQTTGRETETMKLTITTTVVLCRSLGWSASLKPFTTYTPIGTGGLEHTTHVYSLPRMSRCCSEGQLAASSSRSASHTVRLAVRKSLRRRGSLRARCWKHPELL